MVRATSNVCCQPYVDVKDRPNSGVTSLGGRSVTTKQAAKQPSSQLGEPVKPLDDKDAIKGRLEQF